MSCIAPHHVRLAHDLILINTVQYPDTNYGGRERGWDDSRLELLERCGVKRGWEQLVPRKKIFEGYTSNASQRGKAVNHNYVTMSIQIWMPKIVKATS